MTPLLMPARASGYESDAHKDFRNSTRPLDPLWSFSAGAMYSTVEDLQRWSEALRRSTLLPRHTLERMWQPVKAGYGYGWLVPFEIAHAPQGRIIEHGGRVPGFSSSFSLMPDEQLTTIVLTNNVASDAMRLARGLSTIALGMPYVSPLVREPAPIAAETLQRYEGDYELDGGYGRCARTTAASSPTRMNTTTKSKSCRNPTPHSSCVIPT